MTTGKTRTMQRLTVAMIGAALVTGLAARSDAGERATKSRTADASPADAAQKSTKKTPASARRAGTTVRLYGNRWHRDARSAINAAKPVKKPILLIRMLGELDEKT